MHKIIIIAAAIAALPLPTFAAPFETPYALRSAHADFQAQLEEVGARQDDIGKAARAAAALTAPHNAAQEATILPVLCWTDTATSGSREALPELPDAAALQAELARLYDGDVAVVTALVELYAEALDEGDTDTARLAERIIWHQTADLEVFYPAALLVAASLRAPTYSVDRIALQVGPGPLYGSGMLPMMGIGNPHGPVDN
ncbi:hypothetical protein [Tabrizicola soli]|uniref:Uncharacterized protein n=1 Tax=Tabrizicola soli TaxID=2185115 RepID=A0ABV7DZZ7_9RHOB|nr:hypothetical protein [Tabrizicola soli]